MPELPEVECIRRALVGPMRGSCLSLHALYRRDVVSGSRTRRALLDGSCIVELVRRGKQLSLVGADGRTIVVRLGMSGQLLLLPPASPLPSHAHVVWSITNTRDRTQWLVFRDPRRFGGVETFRTTAARDAVWSRLGPDALTVRSTQLVIALGGRRQPIKAALLDQSCLAGVGNIYADEALFLAHIDPARKCTTLSCGDIRCIADAIRFVLKSSIKHGGSSLRDYVLPSQARGSFVSAHQVYGRADLPCRRCKAPLRSTRISGRTTSYCPQCQV